MKTKERVNSIEWNCWFLADAKANTIADAEQNVLSTYRLHCIVIVWLQVVGQSANGQARNEIRVHCAFSEKFEIFENGKNWNWAWELYPMHCEVEIKAI